MPIHALDSSSGLTDAIPGERLVERAALVIVALFLGLALVAGVAMSVVSMNTSISARGGLEPRLVWVARPAETGAVVAVAARTGQRVRAGDLLFTLDTAALAATRRDLSARLAGSRLDELRAASLRPIDLETARARRDLAQAAVDRARARMLTALVDNGRGTDIDSALRAPTSGNSAHIALDLARTDVRQATTELRVADLTYRRMVTDSLDHERGRLTERQVAAQLHVVTTRLAALEVRAATDGIVLTDDLDQLHGRIVRAGEGVLEVGSHDGWRASVLVPESDVGRVAPGQHVDLHISATERDLSEPFKGTVESVAEEPWRPERAVGAPNATPAGPMRYRVVIALTHASDSTLALRRGFSVEARIRLGRERVINVLVSRLFRNSGAP